MVRFSVVEGKEEKRRKLLRPSSSCLPSDGEGEDDDDGGGNSSSAHKEAVTVLIDPDVLDCPICCETLAPPILQCNNGHIACLSCCTKMKKCHSCYFPIGPNRCLALENVIESIKVPCPYASSGCGEIISYAQRRSHEETCIFSPCFCPIAECTFAGSLQQLWHHFRSRHVDHTNFFLYALPFKVSLDENEPIRVFLGEDNVLFLLLNKSDVPVGNVVTMTCIGPDSLKGDFSYQLTARSKESSVHFESSMENIKRWDGDSPSKDFLLIPRGFCGAQGKLSFDVCVRKKQQ
uniref:RING-type E3 ubiquitin transferase n=1 Tax=Anthurium amnicola TaxID=1678845 RepID=A0A1D1YMS4_9ARAE